MNCAAKCILLILSMYMYNSHATGKDDNMRACLRQYGLENQYIDMLVADASRNVWRETELFDAIVTDR